MNLFDPRVRDCLLEFNNLISDSANTLNATPHVKMAIYQITIGMNLLTSDLKQLQLRQLLEGSSPVAKAAVYIKELQVDHFAWDLVKLGSDVLEDHSEWVQHYAFCQYLRWLDQDKIFKGAHPKISTVLKSGGGTKFLLPQWLVKVPQANGSGELNFTYDLPNLDINNLSIHSKLEQLTVVNNVGGLSIHVNQPEFWEQQLGTVTMEPFTPPVILPGSDECVDHVTVTLRDFIKLEDGGLMDGVITINDVGGLNTEVSYRLSSELQTILLGYKHSTAIYWQALPTSVKAIVTAIIEHKAPEGLYKGTNYITTLSLTTTCTFEVSVVAEPVLYTNVRTVGMKRID